jgi:N-acetylglucosaminyldiphosphoundecaprenol N-acetyl-beta-D-mannosaminyltransferase
LSTRHPPIEAPSAVEVLGLPIRPFSLDGLAEWIALRARHRWRTTGCYANAHTVNLALSDGRFRDVLAGCDALIADGVSVVLASRLRGGGLSCRLTAMDYFPLLAERCASEGLSMYLLGCGEGVASRAADALRRQHQGLLITGTHDGHFDLGDSIRVIDRINAARPDILVVGMSSPRQELWLAEHASELIVPVRWCVGALFDYLAGQERRAPAWLRRLHGEWLFRLAMDPRGKWRRYVLGNPRFLWNLLRGPAMARG